MTDQARSPAPNRLKITMIFAAGAGLFALVVVLFIAPSRTILKAPGIQIEHQNDGLGSIVRPSARQPRSEEHAN
ncbi:MAG TPA: hypothetical protein PLH11_04600 [Gemmobacter sp.]|nr:hypothetical protein [Gemmobacter sp.]